KDGGTDTCHVRSKLRNEGLGRKPYRCWVPPGCLYRWRGAHPQRPPGRQQICRERRISRKGTKLPVGKRKTPTAAWRRSMFATRKAQAPARAAHRSPGEAVAVAEAAAVAGVAAAEAADAALAAGAAVAVAVAACRGELAVCAR